MVSIAGQPLYVGVIVMRVFSPDTSTMRSMPRSAMLSTGISGSITSDNRFMIWSLFIFQFHFHIFNYLQFHPAFSGTTLSRSCSGITRRFRDGFSEGIAFPRADARGVQNVRHFFPKGPAWFSYLLSVPAVWRSLGSCSPAQTRQIQKTPVKNLRRILLLRIHNQRE